jgi:hypothetical protein
MLENFSLSKSSKSNVSLTFCTRMNKQIIRQNFEKY